MHVSTPRPKPEYDTSFFGHPRGLATLFFTEMWERFSYYGMRALLILFMTADVTRGGLGFPVPKAAAIYGIYAASNYMFSLPGGWLADRFLGLRRSVLFGGILIACGNAALALPRLTSFYLGLGLIIAGTGMLKPNASSIVGRLYQPGDPRRDSGFTIFYMGINIGAFIAPLAVGYVGQRIDWHLGFGLAAIGMIAGLVQYTLGGKYLGEAGLHPVQPDSETARKRELRQLRLGGLGISLVVIVPLVLNSLGVVQVTAQMINTALGYLLGLTVVGSFIGLLSLGHWTPVERKRIWALLVFFLASALFWSVFEQAGSTLNLFAERNTNKDILGFLVPASWFQSVQPALIILLAPLFAWLWMVLGRKNPSSPIKFALGLVLAGIGFLVLVPASVRSSSVGLVSPMWLLMTYFFHTVGELSLSPVGLSTMTKLAPVRIGSMVMGMWFLSTAVGNYLGARMAALYGSVPLSELFGYVGAFAIVAGVLLAAFAKPIKTLMGGAE